ncbi:MAG: serine/threonine protein kinase [Planctomycetes bacterium]|nr:serine/threonine protein kinase [Planctomycetota bacterium]
MTKIDSQQNSEEPHLHPKAAAEILAALDRVEGEDQDSNDLPRIDGFQIAQRIASGGGGTVYLAFREHSDQPLAIKVMHPRLGKTNASKRAWRELDFLREIRHASIPRLLDHGESDGHIYLVTEFIDGTPLDRYCTSHELDLRKRVDLLARAADIVQSLHEHGVIHRDIKPGNILIDPDENPVLIDLGIATLFDIRDLETLTLVGEPIGSPVCMSPEQARGERESISTRSDVYGLGATGYLLLTGQPPHDVDVPLHEVARRIGNDEPRDPLSLKPSLPRALVAILRKSVSRDAKDRYASAAEFAEDLRRWLRREPVEAQDISRFRRLVRVIIRHPIVSTTTTSILIAGLSLLMTWLAVGWLNAKPASVHVDPIDRSWVRVNSYSGRVLREWNPGLRNGVMLAQIVERAEELGGGRVLVLCQKATPNYDAQSQLYLYDLDDLDEPFFSSGTGPPQINMPEPISIIKGEMFAPGWAFVVDVFAESPGPEIVVNHTHVLYSANVLRIYSLTGEILYEYWHDGGLLSALWIPESGQMVVTAFNSENNWGGRGFSGVKYAPYPLVVYAVKPQYRVLHHAWIKTPGGLGTLEPLWYTCLQPIEALEAMKIKELHLIVRRGPMYDPEIGSSEFDIILQAFGMEYFGFTLDDEGMVRMPLVRENFAYKSLEGVPDSSVFYFGDLPPLLVDPRHPGEPRNQGEAGESGESSGAGD